MQGHAGTTCSPHCETSAKESLSYETAHSITARDPSLRCWLLNQPTPRFHGAPYHDPGLLNIEAAKAPRSACRPQIENDQADISSAQWAPNLPDLEVVKYDGVHICPRHRTFGRSPHLGGVALPDRPQPCRRSGSGPDVLLQWRLPMSDRNYAWELMLALSEKDSSIGFATEVLEWRGAARARLATAVSLPSAPATRCPKHATMKAWRRCLRKMYEVKSNSDQPGSRRQAL